jgi:hypothetical protein
MCGFGIASRKAIAGGVNAPPEINTILSANSGTIRLCGHGDLIRVGLPLGKGLRRVQHEVEKDLSEPGFVGQHGRGLAVPLHEARAVPDSGRDRGPGSDDSQHRHDEPGCERDVATSPFGMTDDAPAL